MSKTTVKTANTYSEEPTLASNLEKTAAIGVQLANNQVSSALNMVADTLNVNPNASVDIIMEQVNNKFKNINDAFQSPEGKQMLAELGALASKLVKTTEEPLKEGQRIFNQMLAEQVRSFEKLAWGAIGLVPVIGDVSEVIRIANDLFEAFVRTMKAVSGISLESSKALEDVKRTIQEQTNLFIRMANLVQKGMSEGNREVNNYLTKASNNLKDQSNYLSNKGKSFGLSKIRKGGAKMTKRVHRSIEKFMSSKVTSAQIKKKYSLKRKSRRHRK